MKHKACYYWLHRLEDSQRELKRIIDTPYVGELTPVRYMASAVIENQPIFSYANR